RILGALMELGYKIEIESLTALSRDETKVDEGFEIILLGKYSEIRLAYEKLYKGKPPYGSYSTPKKVTLAVEVFRGDVVPRVIVFEPRYDLDYSIDRFRVEDLGRLHVLRDSLVDLRDDEHDRIVMGGIVLHPAPAETVRYDDLAGISLRPGATGNPLVEILRGFLEMV
ncbi:MAG: nuclease domain-containing protein, partial [Candidatus Bathyarchaeota archaeon]|nr:nuclease domain-containing protein [Candidatus Bathyarchaeota archaeon]